MRTSQKGSVIIGVIVAVLAIAFTIWYVFFKAESKPVPVAPASIATSTVNVSTNTDEEAKIRQAIEGAPFKVIKVYETDIYKNIVYVATEKAKGTCGDPKNPTPCDDDTICGSRYSVPTCYFFTESKYEVGTTPYTQYIGALSNVGALQLDSLEMKDNRYLYFSTFEGDAGSGFNADYQLDLQTKQFKLLKKTDFHAEM